MNIKKLIDDAIKARRLAYVPYSKFKVGAALLLKDGSVYQGCNIENASYPATNCAERTAFFKAISDGKFNFEAIAIVGWTANVDENNLEYCPPCGVCRQVMREFCSPKEFKIILAKSSDEFKVYTLDQLLPESFGPDNLN